MKTIFVPVGLPGSGKTSWIRKKRSDLTAPSVVISGDQLRLMLNLGEYRYSAEDTKDIRCAMIEMARMFLRRYDVVFLDEFYMSHTKSARFKLRAFVNGYGKEADIEFINMRRDLGACIHRRCTDDRESDTSRWPNVLLDLAATFEPYSHTEDRS